MRAVAVRQLRAPPELLDLPAPVPGAGEISVRIQAAGMNPFDWKIADGALEGRMPHVFPLVLGVDGAGVVDGVGMGVRRFRVGDRVFGQFLHPPVGIGTYCERSVAPETLALAPLPADWAPAQGAALPVAGMTALTALDTLGLATGASLLVVGASGGVGTFAVELGTAAGLRVIAAARPGSHARLRALGAVATLDATAPDLPGQIRAQWPGGVDGALDVMSDADRFHQLAAAIRDGGTAATTLYLADPARVAGGRVRVSNIVLRGSSELLERLVRTIGEHRLPVPVERMIRLEEAPAAVVEGRAGRLSGKTVIVP